MTGGAASRHAHLPQCIYRLRSILSLVNRMSTARIRSGTRSRSVAQRVKLTVLASAQLFSTLHIRLPSTQKGRIIRRQDRGQQISIKDKYYFIM